MNIFCECPENLPVARKAVGMLPGLGRIKTKVLPVKFPKKAFDEDSISHLIGSRIIDANNRTARAVDSFALREYEKGVLRCENRARGVPYDGIGLMRFYRESIENADSVSDEISVVITDRLAMTWSDDDLRYHARVAVFGFPTLISMSGIVEAPARPKEYYLAKQALVSAGKSIDAESALADRFSGRYVEPDDPRTAKILKGYLMQSIFYAARGLPFCNDEQCVLFNPHWQEEMIASQVKSGSLCTKHKKELLEIIS